MTQAIEVHSNGQHAIAAPLLEFSPEQRQLIRDTYANGASDSEFAVLLEVARARKLNPFTRQIHFVKRKDSDGKEIWSAQASIDGLRAIAQRTGLYAGQDEPEFEYSDDGKKLLCARVLVYRKDWPRPCVGIAHFDEYKQTKRDGSLNVFWHTKPRIMLAKCAEALALRKAFPEDMGGLYVPEELGEVTAPDRQLTGGSHSPHGEPDDGVVYREPAEADALIRGFEEQSNLQALRALWAETGLASVDGYESFHPNDRKRLSTAYKRRERQLAKADRELDVAAKDAAGTEDL